MLKTKDSSIEKQVTQSEISSSLASNSKNRSIFSSAKQRVSNLWKGLVLFVVRTLSVWQHSVRGRLTLLNLLLLSVLFIVLIIAQYFLLGNYVTNQQADSLRATAHPTILHQLTTGQISRQSNANYFSEYGTRLATDLSSKETIAIIVDPSGNIYKPQLTATPIPVAGTAPVTATVLPTATATFKPNSMVNLLVYNPALGNTQNLALPLPSQEQFNATLSGQSEESYIANVKNWGRAMVVLVPIHQNISTAPREYVYGDKILGIAIIAGLTGLSGNTEGGLILIDSIAFLVLLIIVGLVSPLVARSSLHPLRRMMRTTTEIAAGDLTRRIQLDNASDEVGQLADSFNTMVGQLETLFKAQRQLIADVSHELRTPLTSIKGSLEVLLLSGASSDPETADQLLKTMHREVVRLTRLVNASLTLNKLDQGEKVELSPVNLGPIVSEVKTNGEMLVRESEKPVEIKLIGFEQKPVVMGYADWLRQVLYNLLDNAIKFSPNDRSSTISLELLPDKTLPSNLESKAKIRGKKRLQSEAADSSIPKLTAKTRPTEAYYGLVVRDEGEGIPAKDLPYVFDRFYRGDASRSRLKGGSGLGLAIVRSLVEAQRGYISVESSTGKGTAFFIYLPAAK